MSHVDKIPVSWGPLDVASAEDSTLHVIKFPSDYGAVRVVGCDVSADADYSAPTGSGTTVAVKVLTEAGASTTLFSEVINDAGGGDITAGLPISLSESSNGSKVINTNGNTVVVDVDNELAAAVGPTGLSGVVWLAPVNEI